MHLLVILADAGIHLSLWIGEVFGWTPASARATEFGKGRPRVIPDSSARPRGFHLPQRMDPRFREGDDCRNQRAMITR